MIPKGPDVEYWMEGIKPGRITLEFKYVRGEVSFSHRQTFTVVTEQTKEEWQQEVRNEILLHSLGQADTNRYQVGPNAAASLAVPFRNNQKYLQAVYRHYESVYMADEDAHLWAGLAKLAGPPVYAGLSDAQWGRVGSLLRVFPTVLRDVTGETLREVQHILIEANINIYLDLAWQFAAYRASGILALEHVNDIDDTQFDIDAWRRIDAGRFAPDPAEINGGNIDLLRREQQRILGQTYQRVANIGWGVLAQLMSKMTQNPIIGGPSFSDARPSGNLAVFDDRWFWITQSMWPLWKDAAKVSRKEWVQTELKTRIENGDFPLAPDPPFFVW